LTLIIAILLTIVIIFLIQIYYAQKIHFISLQVELDDRNNKLLASIDENVELNNLLNQTNFYMEKIQEIARVGAWEIFENKNLIPYWSDGVLEILSLDKSFVPTLENFKKLLSKEEMIDFTKHFLKTKSSRDVLKHDFNYTNNRNHSIRIRTIAYHKFSFEGKYISTVGVFLDITNMNKLETKLMEINSDLDNRIIQEVQKNEEQQEKLFKQSRMAQMGEMISMIAHQWRQPLGAISSTSIDLQMQIDLDTFSMLEKNHDESCQLYFKAELKEIDKLVQNLTNTIDDFRNFYKPNKSKHTGLINEPIVKALGIMRGALKSKGIEIIENYKSKNVLNYYINEVMQVILNILKNAQDNFLENNKENSQISISTFDTNISTVIDIVDNGGGIPQDIIDKIFDPYFSTKDEKNGTGLGLYMSKIIINEHHDGDINVANYDEGVRFTIEFEKGLIL